jgi:pyrimidine operon attenuation protein / uracil phosphoribosyltransferase
MDGGRIIIQKEQFSLTIDRLCLRLMEDFDDFSNTCIIGIQPRGTRLSERLVQRLGKLTDISKLESGKLDITFFRDDYRRKEPMRPSVTQIDFSIDNMKVILVDDVLYTGRTIHAAISALGNYGRPEMVKLVSMIDRRFNRHMPIKSDYVGLAVDSLEQAHVKVEWLEIHGEDKVILFPNRPN